jgi:acyl-CoA synthetase (AMP-forming)/AMP-acid ligase II
VSGKTVEVSAELPAVSQRIAEILTLDPDAKALEFRRTWHTWGQLAASADAVTQHVGPGTRVGILLRNRPAQVGVLIGLLRAGACIVAINPERGINRVRADLAALDLPFIVGEQADLETLVDHTLPGVRLVTRALGEPLELNGQAGTGARTSNPGVAVEMLTSGTTGPPKRIPLTYETFQRVLRGAKHYEGSRAAELKLRSGVAIVNAPMVHLSGVFRVLQCVCDGRAFCLLEKFQIDEWLDAVKRHRPVTVSLVPAALRTVLAADLNPADLSSIRSVISGTAPLDPDDADAFQDKYEIPVLVSYAATEFGGGVAGWNLPDHQKYWSTKRGSVGRAHAGCELRVVDADTGAVLDPNAEGLLEISSHQFGDDAGWVRTTDVARIDEDGFLYIVGRADQAIIRGGFKVHPDEVRAALERDPRVKGAAVVGRSDARLGAVPVAAVELRAGDAGATAADLTERASQGLSRYELPQEIRIVDELPRTPSGKVDLMAVRALFESEG